MAQIGTKKKPGQCMSLSVLKWSTLTLHLSCQYVFFPRVNCTLLCNLNLFSSILHPKLLSWQTITVEVERHSNECDILIFCSISLSRSLKLDYVCSLLCSTHSTTHSNRIWLLCFMAKIKRKIVLLKRTKKVHTHTHQIPKTIRLVYGKSSSPTGFRL